MADQGITEIVQDSRYFQFVYTTYIIVTSFFVEYGWRLVGASLTALILWGYFQPLEAFRAWQRAREDAAYHKDPDRVLAREEEIRRAREAQQRRLLAESERAAELAREREEKKRAELAEMLKKYGAATSGHRLGSADDGFLPLSGGASTSSYRAPKRSACGGGGCGR
ncbi:hypothetical protein MSG28_014391 [Choristoneura fumiferana]|uniref:Uncharacterized protein n=1 Tax=Choristoneura fumiferana TaxID=7141 RepID=A0ACC0JRB8_CHOFU|nr:hypothetical protein MSG28_014391 [Choristoneura fumiferana]